MTLSKDHHTKAAAVSSQLLEPLKELLGDVLARLEALESKVGILTVPTPHTTLHLPPVPGPPPKPSPTSLAGMCTKYIYIYIYIYYTCYIFRCKECVYVGRMGCTCVRVIVDNL